MYTDYLRHVQKLSMEQRGQLFTAILCYATGEEIPELDAAADMAFSFIQDRMDRDNAAYMQKCEKRREAGKLGGMAKASNAKQNVANASNAKNTVANVADNDNENDNENENDKDINTLADAKAMFERLWKMYPNKKGKGQVSDTQKKRLLAIGETTLVKAVERYSLELQKDADWRKAQNGSTFFNSGYVDYLDENYVPGRTQTQKKNSFCNFNQRAYDYGDLEKKLLASQGDGIHPEINTGVQA